MNSAMARLVACILASAALAHATLARVVALAWSDERYTYLLLVPILSAALVWVQRGVRLTRRPGDTVAGVALLLSGLVGMVALWLRPNQNSTVEMVPVVLLWLGSIGVCYGSAALRTLAAPLSILLLAIPLPPSWMHAGEVFLQHASAEVSHLLFLAIGSPVHREGLVFSLPGLDVQVAEECSGIRSTTGLVIMTGLASYLFLRLSWTRLCFILFAIPVGIFKNAVRIVTISWLSAYVSADYMTGTLHRYGGPPFTMVAIALLLPALLLLRRAERARQLSARSAPGVKV